MEPIKTACAIVGNQASLAKALGVTPGLIYQWITGHRRVAAEHCPRIEALTNGLVRCETIRPDVPWGVLRKRR